MRYISAKPQRLYCNTCDETYALPQGGTVKLYKVTYSLITASFTVSYCRSWSVHWMALNWSFFLQGLEAKWGIDRSDGVVTSAFILIFQTFHLCPFCYNQPPFPWIPKGMGCNRCTHASCPHALPQLSVCDCTECEGGALVLDPASGPCWRLACNDIQYVWLSGYHP